MKMLLALGGLIGALLLPALSWGADGDSCQSHTADAAIPLFNKGVWIPIACVQLCDGKAAADSACTEFDFADAPGMPELIVLEYEEDPANMDCSGTPDYTFTTGPITGGTPSYAIDATAVIANPTTNRIVIDVSQAPLDRFLFTAIADDAGCTDVDVRMFLYTRKTGLF